jgi:hypothetical protein
MSKPVINDNALLEALNLAWADFLCGRAMAYNEDWHENRAAWLLSFDGHSKADCRAMVDEYLRNVGWRAPR